MRLYVCEKPNAARSLATALGRHNEIKPHGRGHFAGHLEGHDWRVVSLLGHFYELSDPQDHDPKYASWNLSDLPIIIRDPYWKVPTPLEDSPGLSHDEMVLHIEHVKSLLSTTNEVVIACDAGQEGQLIGQVFIEQAGWSGTLSRLWTGNWEVAAVKKALGCIEPNEKYQGYYDAAYARTVADKALGINFTRLFRILAKQSGYNIKGSTGRVRSPALAITVSHDLKHENHKASKYFTVKGIFNLKSESHSFSAALALPDRLKPDGSHCTDEIALNNYLDGAQGLRVATVRSVDNKTESRTIPAPFDQNSLSQLASTEFGFMPERTLAICQSLYDQGLMSYPRTDENVYEAAVLENAPLVVDMLAKLHPDLAADVKHVDVNNHPDVFDDSRVEEHSALYVTNKKPNFEKMDSDLQKIYLTVAKRLLAQFAGVMTVIQTKIVIEAEDYTFYIGGQAISENGWGHIEPPKNEDDVLPIVRVGDELIINDLETESKKTKAPPRLTVARFQALLKDCTAFLSDSVRSRAGKGQLGTAATQPTYMKSLALAKDIKIVSGKYVVSTKQGRNLNDITPQYIRSPDMSSLWEIQFKAIRKGTQTKENFLNNVFSWIDNQIIDGKKLKFKTSPLFQPCPKCGCALIRYESRDKYGDAYYRCSNGDTCNTTISDYGGKPMQPLLNEGTPCPNCGEPMITRLGRKKIPPKGKSMKTERRYLACPVRCTKANSIADKKETG